MTPPITTTLSGEEVSDAEIEVLEGAPVTDEATLHSENASKAQGTVDYFVYADSECEELVKEAGKVKVEGEKVPPSNEVELEAGTYYWQADYSGDEKNPPATSACGAEVLTVTTATSLSTSLSGGAEEGEEIEVNEGTPVRDLAILSGANAATAEGMVEYAVYSDSECKHAVAAADVVEVSEGEVPPSSWMTLPAGVYYWTARYTGDGLNHPATEPCGSEIATVSAPITTQLSDGEQTGTEIEVAEGTPITDQATLHGEKASEAKGTVDYFVYADPECKELAKEAGKVKVEGEKVPPSNEVELESGTYYWQAKYSDEEENPPVTSTCGVEVSQITNLKKDKYASLGDSFAAGVGTASKSNSGEPIEPYYGHTSTWATEAAYLGPVPNKHNGCRRSPAGWSPLLAKALYGAGVAATDEVFKQEPPLFIFRACSGAEISHHISPNAGQWDEYVKGLVRPWFPKPAQTLWLKKQPAGSVTGMANDDIKLVTITVGINDAKLSNVVQSCLQWPFQSDAFYSPVSCINSVITNVNIGRTLIETKLPALLTQVIQYAPKARIRIPLYPRGIHWWKEPRRNISLAIGLKLNNLTFPPPSAPGVPQMTAAMAVYAFVEELNKKIEETVKTWGTANPSKDAKVLPETLDSLAGHQLGDQKPWLNGLTLVRLGESAHPTVCGQRAVAVELLRKVGWIGKGPRPVKC